MKINDEISLRKISDNEKEYQMLHKWCSKRFVYKYFEQKVLSLAEIKKKYSKRIEDGKYVTRIIEYLNKPIGLVQYQKEKKGYQIDIFIGEEKYRGKKIGQKIIKVLSDKLLEDADEVAMIPFKENIAAIKCYQNAGFEIINEIEDKDTLGNVTQNVLMIKRKKEGLHIKDKVLLEVCENVNLDDYQKLSCEVKEYMDDPNHLGDLSKDDLVKEIEKGGKIWLYYLDDKPICSMMLVMVEKDLMYRYELNKFPYQKCVDYGPMMVHPRYVGFSLQKQMLKKLNEEAKKMKYEYAICTVHPDNKYSRKNIENDGFVLKVQKEFRRGNRNIYVKDLKEDL